MWKTIRFVFEAAFWLPVMLLSGVIDVLKNLGFTWNKEEFSAKWTTGRDLKPFLRGDGFVVSKQGRRLVRLDSERSAIVFGQPGTGKSMMTMANLENIEGTPDLLVVDPKGELLAFSEKMLVLKGYDIIKIDLTDPLNSAGYDCLSYIERNSRYEVGRDTISICDLLTPEGVGMSDTAQHFQESARNMVQSAILGLESWTLPDILTMLVVDKKRRTDVFESLRTHKHRLVRQGVEAFVSAGDRERGAMDSTLSRKLRPFLDEANLEVMRGDWSFEDKFRADRPFALFINTGMRNKINGGPFARLVVGCALNTVRRMFDRKEDRKRPFWVFLDEAPILENCQPIVEALTDLRSARVRLWACFHSHETVTSTYRNAGKLLDNMAWVISGGSKDIPLYEAAEKLAGEKVRTSKSVSKGDRKSETEHEARGPLVTVGEMHALRKSEVLAIAPGLLFKGQKPAPAGVKLRD